MKQRIYIDTSVVGGYFDEEFKEATIKLFERLDNNEIILIVSDLLDLELINAPQQVREHLLKYSADKFQRVELTEEAIKLADIYINKNVVGKTSLEYYRHIALATIHKLCSRQDKINLKLNNMKRFISLTALILLMNITFGQAPFKTGVNFPYYIPNFKSIDQYLQLVNDCGAKSIRQMTWGDVFWKNVEPTDNNWDWGRSDSSFFNPFNLTPIGTLYSMMGNDSIGMQTPWLACSNPFTCFWDPAGDSLYSKDYVQTTVNRYKNVTKYWEVTNEIESALPPAGLPNIFTKKEFLRYNYMWIKQADPTANVLLPGLLGTCCTYPVSNSYDWLRNMLNAGAGNYFDIMNYHDYNAWWTLPAHYDSVQNILTQYNLNKPIWITETAVSSVNLSPITPSYSSPDEQAADVWRRIGLLWGKGAEVVLWHSNWSSNDMSGWGEFGLVSNNGTKKKSWHSYKLLNEKITNFSSVNIISLGTITTNNTTGGNGVWVLHFIVNGINKWVLWSPNNQAYSLSGINSTSIEVTEVVPSQLLNNGDSAVFNKHIYSVSGGSYNFNYLSSLPILVEEISTTGANEHNLIDDFTMIVYPNPSQNIITLQTNSRLDNAHIIITDIMRQELLNLSNISGERINVTLDKFEKGIYFITVKNNERMITKKFLVQ